MDFTGSAHSLTTQVPCHKPATAARHPASRKTISIPSGSGLVQSPCIGSAASLPFCPVSPRLPRRTPDTTERDYRNADGRSASTVWFRVSSVGSLYISRYDIASDFASASPGHSGVNSFDRGERSIVTDNPVQIGSFVAKLDIRRARLGVATMSLALAFLSSTTAHAQMPAGPDRPAGVPDGYVITPSGYFHPSCVRQLAEGDTLLLDRHAVQHANRTIEDLPACRYPHYGPNGEVAASGSQGAALPTNSGWVEKVEATTISAYGELTASWTVPPAPANSANCQAYPNTCQTIFFFPGFQQNDNPSTTILQPVLVKTVHRPSRGLGSRKLELLSRRK